MKSLVSLCLILALAGCGADDPPFVPSAGLGVSVSNSGISPSANFGASNGTVSFGIGL